MGIRRDSGSVPYASGARPLRAPLNTARRPRRPLGRIGAYGPFTARQPVFACASANCNAYGPLACAIARADIGPQYTHACIIRAHGPGLPNSISNHYWAWACACASKNPGPGRGAGPLPGWGLLWQNRVKPALVFCATTDRGKLTVVLCHV